MARCRDIRILSAILILIGASAAFGAEETWLRYSALGVSATGRLPIAANKLDITVDPPPGVALPEFAGWIQFYGALKAPLSPSGSIAVVLDITENRREIYIDSNCDGSLADEKPVGPDLRHETWDSAVHGPAKVVFPSADGPVAYHMRFRSMHTDEGASLYVYSACCYEGTVDVDGTSYGVTLVDSNCNGTFNDVFSADAPSDSIVLSGPGAEATLRVGRYVDIAGSLYNLDIAVDGAYVKFSPAADVVTGKVVVPAEVTALTIAGANGSFSLVPPGKVLTVPPGDYFVSRWILQRTDDNGIVWTAYAGAGADATATTVPADGETAFDISDPFIATVDVSLRGGEYLINGGLKGRLGERVAIAASSRSVPKPELRITNADGTYDKTFSLEYG